MIPETPGVLSGQGYDIDPITGEFRGPDGGPADAAEVFPDAGCFPAGSTYDPDSGNYYAPDGSQSPPPRGENGWTFDPATGKFVDPTGK